MLRTLVLISGTGALALAPRRPLESTFQFSEVYQEQQDQGLDHELLVKFQDNLRARAHTAGSLVHDSSLQFESMVQDTPQLRSFLDKAQQRSDREQPDLAGILRVGGTGHSMGIESMVALAAKLDALDVVEYVEIATMHTPPPVMDGATGRNVGPCNTDDTDVDEQQYAVRNDTSDTPLFTDQQRYMYSEEEYGGVDAHFANDHGYLGQGVRLSDCEYDWFPRHEDIEGTIMQPASHPSGRGCFQDHGAATAGVAMSHDNSFGTTGIATEADGFWVYTEYPSSGYNRVASVTNAVRDSELGDVVLLEMQATYGGSSAYVPAETSQSIWSVVRAASDAGVIVVAAAGNGNADLDSAFYQEYRNRGDSGSIIVGAGIGDTTHERASFSTYGSRVNVQGWGDWSVFTHGYGDQPYPGYNDITMRELRSYTYSYSGTSSASALIAPCVAVVQSAASQVLDSYEMRELLADTGVPQGLDTRHQNIGPHVNLRNAIEYLNKHEMTA